MPSSAFEQIKDFESQVEFPSHATEIVLGEFDPRRGFTFSDKVRVERIRPQEYGDDFGGAGTLAEEIVFNWLDADAVHVAFIVKLTRFDPSIELTYTPMISSGGRPPEPTDLAPPFDLLGETELETFPSFRGSISPGERKIRFDVRRATVVNFTIRSAQQGQSSSILIDRPLISDAGVFTIPALPSAVVYDAPQLGGAKNTVSYYLSNRVSTRHKFTTSRSSSTTRASMDHEFRDVERFQRMVSNVGNAMQALSGKYPKAGAVGAALSSIGAVLGEVNQESTEESFTENSFELVTRNSTSLSWETGGGGPGVGDLVVYYRNVEVAWLVTLGDYPDEDRVRFCVIGSAGSEPVATPVEILISDYNSMASTSAVYADSSPPTHGSAGLDAATTASLLALDPFVRFDPLMGRFVSNPKAGLPTQRFRDINKFVENAPPGPHNHEVEHETESTDFVRTGFSRVVTTHYRSGLLGSIGVGVGEDKTTEISTSTQIDRSDSNLDVVKLKIRSVGGEKFRLAAKLDRRFGTLAFVEEDIVLRRMILDGVVGWNFAVLDGRG